MILHWIARRREPEIVTDGLTVAVAQTMAWERGLDDPTPAIWKEAKEWTVRNRRRRDELGLPQWPY